MTPQYSHPTRLREYIAFMLPWAHGHQLKSIADYVAAIIEAKLYGAPHQAKMRFRLLCSFRRPYAMRWISLILLLNPSVMPLV